MVELRQSKESNGEVMVELVTRLEAVFKSLYFYNALLLPSIADAIAAHSTALRHFTFDPELARNFPEAQMCTVLEARGSGLELLHITNFKAQHQVVRAIAENCRNLRQLKLACRDLSCSLIPIWKSIGSNQETLEVMCYRGCNLRNLALDDLSTHCPNISCFFFDLGRENDEWIEMTCKSYGSKLQELSLSHDGIQNSTLTRIRAICPNIHIDVRERILL